MEAILSSCSSPNFFQENPSSSTLKQRLQFIVESNAAECWVYAIFWKASGDNSLSWGGGHYKSSNIISYPPKLGFHDVDFLGDNDGGDVTDSEWFYFYSVSLTQSFTAENNILGRVFCSRGFVWLAGDHEFQLYECERVKEARMHEIQTLVCIATSSGVLELASLDAIKQDWGLVHLTKSLFRSKGDDHDDQNRISKLQASHEANVLVPPLKNGRFLETQKELTTQEGGRVEAIPLNVGRSSSPDSRSNSVGNITSKNTENTRSRKRGRSSSKHESASRESQLLSHVEAERIRRVKLNHRFCVLRSVVPNVSKMDRSSLLADAVAYINQLKANVEELEAKIQAQLPPPQKSKVDNNNNNEINIINLDQNLSDNGNSAGGGVVEVDVKIIGSSQAMIRVQCPDQDYPYSRLMNALKGLGLQVFHASISSVNELMIQNVVTGLPYGFTSRKALRLGIIKRWHT